MLKQEQGKFEFVPLEGPSGWEDFDSRGKGKEKEIKKQARNDAAVGIPSADGDLSPTEIEFQGYASLYQKKLAANGALYFGKCESELISFTAAVHQNNFNILYQDLTREVKHLIQKAELNLTEMKKNHEKNLADYELFKTANGLRRPPSPATAQKFLLQVGVVFILFAVEIAINNNLVDMEGGKLESIALAVGVAFLNVFVSLAVGYYFLKHITHIDMRQRIYGVSALVLHITIFFCINWAYGAFRTLKDMEEGKAEKLSALKPWTVDIEFMSVILLFIGFSFAVFSLLDGYFLDDTYPGYGKTARTYNKSKKGIMAELNRLLLQEAFDGKSKESVETRNDLYGIIDKWNYKTNLVQRYFKDYTSKIQSAEECINQMLRQYVAENRVSRNEVKYPLPERLKETSSFLYAYPDELKDPHKVFEAAADAYMNDAERKEESVKLRKKVDENFDTLTRQIQEFREETRITAKEIQKKYAPA